MTIFPLLILGAVVAVAARPGVLASAHQPKPPVRVSVELPAFPDRTCVLFQGDSITDGGRWRDNEDPNHVFGQGYAYLIAARFGASAPAATVTFVNRGISGDTVQSLAARWQKDTLAIKPDVLSVLVGVNDAMSAMGGRPGSSAEEYERVYDQLLGDTMAAMPGVKLVLCESFTLPVGAKKAHWEEWRAEVRKRQDIVARLAAKYHAPVVRFQKMFDDACKDAPAEHWIWDGVHPTYAGHQLMADEWIRTINAFYYSK